MPTRKRSTWIDVTVPVKDGMVHWPSNPPVKIDRISDIRKGASSNVSLITMGSHTGTHMDSPLHFFPNGKGLDKMPLEATMGPCRVIEIKHKWFITVEEIRPKQIRQGERILFKTRNSKRCWKTDKFINDFVHFSVDAAKFLAEKKVQTIGVDYLSVGGHKSHSTNGREVHLALLGAGIWVIEGLNLSKVKPGKYDLAALPMKLKDGDGGPTRVVIQPRS